MADEQTARERGLVHNILLVMVFFGLAALAGTVRNIIIGGLFGISADLDAYYAAFKLPDLLFTIVAGGALATAFIPVFADFLTGDDMTGAWQLASDVTNGVVLVASGLAIAAAVFAPALVAYVIAPGFDPRQQELTVQMMRIVLISVPIFGISAVQTSVLHAFKQFLLPAMAAVLYPVGVILGAVFLTPYIGILGLAVGAVIGSLLHLAVKVPLLLRLGLRFWPSVTMQRRALRHVLLLMGPRVLDLAVFHLTFVAMTNLASRLQPGSVSALQWGWEAMQLPETIIGTAFGLVAFPTLAELAARGDIPGVRATLGEMLRLAVTLALPATFALILLGRPLLQLLYQRGAFQESATQAVYVALVCFTVGLVGQVSLELVARTFFAQKDTVTPLLLAVASGVVSVGLGVVLMQPLGYGGLALAYSIAVTAEVVGLLLILRRRLAGVEGRKLAVTLAKALAASAVMSLVLVLVLGAARDRQASALVILIVGVVTGGAAYVASGLLFGLEPLRRLPSLLFGRD
jgi:putative peptidoglycan lipid II flippase